MKLLAGFLLGSNADTIRRFSQLTTMMGKHNTNFNVYKDLAYGCNCNLLASGGTGDRPLTQAGWGQAIDSIDVVCKAYKDCQKCVEAEHGGDCIGENVLYNYSWTSNLYASKAQCNDAAGSCKRALCECDSTFAFNQANKVNAEYNQAYSHYYGIFDYERICPNICHLQTINLDNTGKYTGNNDLDGSYTVKDELVNDHKCYILDNKLIVFEDDFNGEPAWVIYDGDTAVFYGTTDVVCPNAVEWEYIGEGTGSGTGTGGGGITGGGGGPNPGVGGTNPTLDEACCPSSTGPFLLYNANTHICCSDGSTPLMGNLC